MKRVSPSERTREAMEALLRSGVGGEGDLQGELIRLGIRRIVEEALEAKVSDLLGRGYYQRRETGAEGHRNGYRGGRLPTAEGEVPYAVPQLPEMPGSDQEGAGRGTQEGAFCGQLAGAATILGAPG